VDQLLNAVLSNALAACFLAVLVAVVGFLYRRPALLHVLWLFVLIKLITPPLVHITVPELTWPTLPAPVDTPVEEETVSSPGTTISESPEIAEAILLLEEEGNPPVREPEKPEVLPQAQHFLTAVPEPISWKNLAILLWLAGSLGWVVLALVRIRRFQGLLPNGRRGPTWLQKETRALAKCLGLKTYPLVWLLPGRVTPMLWTLGRMPRLLVPAGLLDRLGQTERQALLVHELAHLRRGDHWVRLFELVVTALFWWHPVVWWARHQIREAEEQCCDAWVLWVLPGSARAYALTLVETVDYLSESRHVKPLLASGLGPGDDLKRRLTMIMRGTTPRALTRASLLGLLAMGIFLLPLMPGLAQDREKRTPDQDRPAQEQRAQKQIADLQRQLERHHAEIRQIEQRIRQIQGEIGRRGDPGLKRERKVEIQKVEIQGEKGRPGPPEPKREVRVEVKEVNGTKIIQLAPKSGQIIRGEGRVIVAEAPKDPKAKGPMRIEIREGDKVRVIELPAGSRVISGGEKGREEVKVYAIAKGVNLGVSPPVPAVRFHPPGGGPPEAERRLAEVERRLGDLTRMIDELRGELRRIPHLAPGMPGTPPGMHMPGPPPGDSGLRRNPQPNPPGGPLPPHGGPGQPGSPPGGGGSPPPGHQHGGPGHPPQPTR
jgi:beta-lactamase regulating signal transducer with metallopeptidase domain